MACKDCHFYRRKNAENKAGRVMRNAVAPCDYEIELPPLPLSLRGNGRLEKRFMEPFDGVGCPTFKQRAKA